MKTKFTFGYFMALLPVICCFHLTLYAQVSPNASTANWDTLSFKSYADYKLQLLNKSYITTGILYDRVLLIVDVDGHLVGMASPDTTFPNHSMELPVLISAADKNYFFIYKNKLISLINC